MCIEAVYKDAYSLQYVSDFWVTQNLIQACQDGISSHDSDEVIEWYKGYKQRKTQKEQIKEELMPVAWHPNRYWDWCMPKDEKQDISGLWS